KKLKNKSINKLTSFIVWINLSLMKRKYADYEYKINGNTVRIEKGSGPNQWVFRVFFKSGFYTSSNELGEYCTTKREAKKTAFFIVYNENHYN
ncbi:hypothetical protein COB55_05790, partial [Candidatus Wolfebacteria bacterium]